METTVPIIFLTHLKGTHSQLYSTYTTIASVITGNKHQIILLPTIIYKINCQQPDMMCIGTWGLLHIWGCGLGGLEERPWQYQLGWRKTKAL